MSYEEKYMRRAIDLARRGEGWTSPNPMVGCVVVKNGQIVSEGWHERCGKNHAERNALLHCREEDAEGAELYVTLEPCCHTGRTPPCTDIILQRKIGAVYVGSEDPNPKVAGGGLRILREAGVKVETGHLQRECIRLNEVFFHYIKTGTPFIVSKYAMSLDGKIACAGGDSKWVTGKEAREAVHRLRNRYRAILVGIGTVLLDDPLLNCRMEGGRNPVRGICDSNLRLPLKSRITESAWEIRTLDVCSETAAAARENREKRAGLEKAGVEILPCGTEPKIDLRRLFAELGKLGIDSVLVEGGGTLNGSLFEAGLVQKVYAFLGGKIIGGREAKSPVEGRGAALMKDAVLLRELQIRRFGDDFCICGYPQPGPEEGK